MSKVKPKPYQACTVFSPRQAGLWVHPSNHVELGVSEYGALLPHHAHQFHLWEGWCLGAKAFSLLPLPSGCWPFKARACPGVTRRGGCGWEQGAHSAAAAAATRLGRSRCLRAAYRLAWDGRWEGNWQRQGETWGRQRRQGLGERQRDRPRDRETKRDQLA